ncbi:hypothetical protein [Bradyrhizobium erythrophlei]|uniref:Uncharacterized protein n=1 Tax=Bradyrhizobium erythrophlei TaxID=1437360 RepID=A0A1M5LGS4_9BRAD|nr:hypothetical protein [Bradyrhizobium erythrophlei]SHG64166.1 hypothetical protein SAMN05444169_3455 [Bradyrhizobium erythrophlei]
MSDTYMFEDNLDKSIPIDWSARLPDFQDVVAELTTKTIAFHRLEAVRPVKPTTREKIRKTIDCLLANLVKAAVASPECFLAIPQSSGAFTQSRYNNHGIGYDNTKRVVDYLKGCSPQLVSYNIGFNDRSRSGARTYVTRIRALPALLGRQTSPSQSGNDQNGQSLAELILNIPLPITSRKPLTGMSVVHTLSETIRLKDTQKKLVSYQGDETTEGMRARLKRWNDYAGHQCIDLFLTDDQLLHMYDQPSEEEEAEDEPFREEEDRPRFVDLTRNRLYRVFNNGSFDQGGRFYGGWWQRVPSKYRRSIVINWTPTRELDYSGLHAAMLYALGGLHLEQYPYSLDGVNPDYKKLIKSTFFKLINAQEGQAIRAPRPGRLPPRLTWPQLQEAIKDKHHRIAQHFNSGVGLKLQKKDSEIAEDVMFRMGEQDCPALPIHDSFITYWAAYNNLKRAMMETYHRHMNSEISVTIDDSFFDTILGQDNPTDPNDTDVEQAHWEDVAQNAPGYEGYRARKADFLARQTPERRDYLEDRRIG